MDLCRVRSPHCISNTNEKGFLVWLRLTLDDLKRKKKKTIAMETKNQDVSNSGMVTPGHEQPGFAFQIELHNRGTRVRGAMVNLKKVRTETGAAVGKDTTKLGEGRKKKVSKKRVSVKLSTNILLAVFASGCVTGMCPFSFVLGDQPINDSHK